MSPYTEDERFLIETRIRQLRANGNPSAAFKLRERYRRGEAISPAEYTTTGVRPEKEVADHTLLEPPPYTGPGSSAEAWRDFARNVIDIEEDVLEAFNRGDVISLLRERGVLPPKEDDD